MSATATKRTKPCPECGRSLHADAVKCSCGWQDARAAARAGSANRHACTAHGCCLPGTLFGGAQDREGWCYLHDAHREGHDLQALTRAINMRRRLFDAVHALYADVDQVSFWTGIPGRYAKPFRELRREDLLPTAEERKKTRQAWLGRARRDLEAEVLAELGVQIKRGAPKADDDRRTYAPTEEDIAAARAAEEAIAAGTWKRVGDLQEAA